MIFNPETVLDTGTFTKPRQHPRGIELAMINGTIAHGGEKFEAEVDRQNCPAGRVLRRAS